MRACCAESGRGWLAAAALIGSLGLAACAVGPQPDVAGAPPPPSDPDAVQWIERWFYQAHGFDALETYRIRASDGTFEFALARKWSDANEAHVLTRAIEPFESVLLLALEPGGTARIISAYPANRNPLMDGPRVIPLGAGLGSGSAVALARETAVPTVVPANFAHYRRPDEVIAREECVVVESVPLRPTRFLTRVVTAISRRTQVALRSVVYRDDRVVRSVHVHPGEVIRHESGWLAQFRRIETADGLTGELELLQFTLDPALPDHLFSERNLKRRRLPSF